MSSSHYRPPTNNYSGAPPRDPASQAPRNARKQSQASVYRQARLLSENISRASIVATQGSHDSAGLSIATNAFARTVAEDHFRRDHEFETAVRPRPSMAVANAFAAIHTDPRKASTDPTASSSFAVRYTMRPGKHIDVASLQRPSIAPLPSRSTRIPSMSHLEQELREDDDDLDEMVANLNNAKSPGGASDDSRQELIDTPKKVIDYEFGELFAAAIDRGDSRRRCLQIIKERLDWYLHHLNDKEEPDNRVGMQSPDSQSSEEQHQEEESSQDENTVDRRAMDTKEFDWLYARFEAFRAYPEVDFEEKIVLFPHIAEVCFRLANLCAYDGEYERAVQLSNHALDLKVFMCRKRILYSTENVYEQWSVLRAHLLRCPSLSKKGMIAYVENLSTDLYSSWISRKDHANDDPDFLLCRWITSEISSLRMNRFEKWANILLVYAAFCLIAFLLTRCYVESSCSGPGQMVTVDHGTFLSTPPSFSELDLLPRCASTCEGARLCTCEPADLDCSMNARPSNPKAGSACFCRNPVCDACGICGGIRALLREHAMEIFWFSTALDLLLLIIGMVAVTYPPPTLDGTPALDRAFFLDRSQSIKDVALMIAHYGDRGPMEATLKAALQLFPPDKIYVCHNGPSDAPLDQGKVLDTYNCVQEMSRWYREQSGIANAPDINYVWSCDGNKTLAVFQAALLFSKDKYVAIMDNDCLLPKDLSVPTHLIEDKDNVKAFAFVIRASNIWQADGSRNMWPSMQDLEYKKAAVMKLLQSQMSTTLFAHGAFALWKRDACLDVFMRHNTNFHGEDYQMGILLQRFNKGYQMKVVGNVSVPTCTPAHFMCCPWNTAKAKKSGKSAIIRMLTAPFRCSAWGCPHEEKSLFSQRSRSWDMSAQRMIWESISLLFFVWNRSILVLKPFLLYELWSVIQDYIRIPLLVFILMSEERAQLWGMLAIMSMLGRTLLFVIMELWTFRRRQDLRSGMMVAMLYSFYNMVLLFTRMVGILYNTAVYLPRVRNGKKVKNRAQLPGMIHGRYISPTSADPPEPTPEHLVSDTTDSRVSPQLQGAKRLPDNTGWQLLQWENNAWKPWHTICDKNPLNVPKIHKDTDDMDFLGYVMLAVLLCASVLAALYSNESTFQLSIYMIASFVAVLHICYLSWT